MISLGRTQPARHLEGPLVFFSLVKVIIDGGTAYIDVRHWRRFRLYLEPFRQATLVCNCEHRAAPADWLPLPSSVRVIGASGRGRSFGPRDVWAAPPIALRMMPQVRRAAMIGLISAVHPIDYAGLLLALLLRKPILGVRIGSVRRSYAARPTASAVEMLRARLKSSVGGLAELILTRRASVLLVAGEQLRRETGRGFAFSTSLFDRSMLSPARDTCAGDTVVWAYAGTLSEQKGTDTLLRALAIARREDARHLALLIGPNVKPFRELARDLGVEEAVTFAGPVVWERVFPLLSQSDVFVFPSLHEGMPKAPLEAMSQSLPVVVTPAGSANYVRDGENGLVVPPSDPVALAAAVRRICNDPNLRGQVIRGALATAAECTLDASLSLAHSYLCRTVPTLTDPQKHDWDELENPSRPDDSTVR